MKKRAFDALCSLILTLMAVLPLLRLICGSFDIECTVRVYAFAAASCFICCGFWLLPKYWYAFTAALAVLALAPVWGHTADFSQSARAFFSRVCEVYCAVFPQLELKYAAADGGCGRFLYILGLVMAFVIAMAVTAPHGRTLFSFLATLPFFIFAIIVDSYPGAGSIFCLSLFWAVTLASRFGRRRALAAALPLGLLLALIMLRVGPSGFSGDDAQSRLAARFDAASERVMALLGKDEPALKSSPLPAPQPDPTAAPTPAAPSAQPSKAPARANAPAAYTEGDMTMQVSGVRAPDTTGGAVMRVRSTLGGLMYLRSYSLGNYTGYGWERGEDRNSSLGFAYDAALALGAPEHTVEIERIGDTGSLRHTPYYADAEGGSCSYIDQSSYTVTFLSPSSALGGGLLDFGEERAYRDWAHGVFTALSDAERAKMLEIAQSAGISPDDGDIISNVAEYVSSCAQYDLAAPPVPAGEDCAVYFLTVSRRGFCIHFATAAAVMYRALGVPARVVSGFMFTAAENEWVTVTDKNAHAWVEVYLDGTGWIPVEVTGSAAPYVPDDAPQDLRQSAREPSVGVTVGVIASEEKPSSPAVRAMLCVVSCAALLTAAAVLRRKLLLRRREARFSGADPSAAVCAMWRHAAALSRFGAPPPEALRELAERAYYSKQGASDAERAQALALLRDYSADAAAALRRPALFAAKYIFALF